MNNADMINPNMSIRLNAGYKKLANQHIIPIPPKMQMTITIIEKAEIAIMMAIKIIFPTRYSLPISPVIVNPLEHTNR